MVLLELQKAVWASKEEETSMTLQFETVGV